MADKKQRTEWLANAELCLRMAERSHEPSLQARWLTLAQQWMSLRESVPETQTRSEELEAPADGRRNRSSRHQPAGRIFPDSSQKRH